MSFDGPQLQSLGANYGRVVSSSMFYSDVDQRATGAGKLVYATGDECAFARAQLRDARLQGRTLRVSFWNGKARRNEEREVEDRTTIALRSERLAKDALFAVSEVMRLPDEDRQRADEKLAELQREMDKVDSVLGEPEIALHLKKLAEEAGTAWETACSRKAQLAADQAEQLLHDIQDLEQRRYTIERARDESRRATEEKVAEMQNKSLEARRAAMTARIK